MNWCNENFELLAEFARLRFLKFRAGYSAAKLLAYLRFPTDGKRRKRLRYQLTEAKKLCISRRFKLLERSSTLFETDRNSPFPSVSAIIPNYNHARFLERRICSVLQQRRQVSELIILDDASTDNSLDVIHRAIGDTSIPCRVICNETNSGSIFQQWQKGLSLAGGDIVWMCESDDDCDPGFLEALVPYFADPSVMLAFGDIKFIDEEGNERRDINDYKNLSDFFSTPHVASAHAWFNGPLGTRCIITNVGGCLFRRQNLSSDIGLEIATYRTCGDWFLYSRLARGGKIVFDPKAQASFRVHGNNSSVSSFRTAAYYRECLRVLQAFRRHYEVDPRVSRAALRNVYDQCVEHLGVTVARELIGEKSCRTTTSTVRTINHVVVFVSSSTISEIKGKVAELAYGGDDVSLVVADQEFARELRSALPGEIAVFVGGTSTVSDRVFINAFGATSCVHW